MVSRPWIIDPTDGIKMDSNKYGLVNLIEGKISPLPCLFFLCPFSPKMTIGDRKMVKQKQKWTREEEEALSAGVAKYGQGKWKVILTDPQFAPSLVIRSNIDLKVVFFSPLFF